ncbi:MAG: hypothetical protein KGJ57_01835 [Sphingomonadales bacterium]|nr:hypothetical protein [Sphingomonadales bacterium]MDE2168150.1 hypothetical protein [Sphingomonadales bacterium]
MHLLDLLTTRGLAPHGYCLLWDPILIWLHVVSDAIVGLSYFSIPVALTVFLARRRDIEFGWLLILFAIFIMACGTTHFMSILVLWIPAYGLEGLVKAVTAIASVLTAVLLWPLLPKLIALPSPRQLQEANEQLKREACERERMEQQLRQVQKLDAIGRLTGGIAHDFNNILAIIMGSLERATRRIDSPEQAREALQHAMAASERAAHLTEQLLAFARQKPMATQRCDINDILRDFEPLIRQAIGSNIDLNMALAPTPVPVDIDRSQFETALINLAVNARDAMPEGGTLAITVEPAGSGSDSVTITVEDTGEGMDQEVLARATEPFFTTKAVGKGTGLGLSQVYGFTSQMGGAFSLHSSPGAGTRAIMTLMRVA